MMKKIYFFIILGLFLSFAPAVVQGTEVGDSFNLNSIKNLLPAPINDLVNTVQKITPNFQSPFFQNLQNTVQNLKTESLNTQNFLDKFKEIFYKINNWFEINLGVSLVAILKAIGNVIVWIFETFIKLIKTAISYL